jgi:hypothetical protein
MTGLWKNWMLTWCAAAFGLGAALAAAAFPATDGIARFYYDLIYWPLDGASAFGDEIRFTVAVLGAVLIGWAITLFAMVSAAARLGAPVWRSLTGAVVAWFVIDSALSVATGVPMNALANAGFLITFLAPIVGAGVLRNENRLAAA